MENRDYESILDVMPETGVYVIREEDHGLLYFNRRVREISPQARLGAPCHDVWAGSCSNCPLLTMEDQEESRSVSYNELYGGMVDIIASRTLWEGTLPAFVVTVSPHRDAIGYTYRKILHVDLLRDHCIVLKSDPYGWQPEEGPLSQQLAQFANGPAIHPEDAERFATFIQLENVRASLRDSQIVPTLIYRRRADEGYRWNLMELVPDQVRDGEVQSAVFCVKDVHDLLREGLELGGLTVRGQELIRSLGERNFNIYTIDLKSGLADPIRVDGQMREEFASAPWSGLMRTHIAERLHEAYQDEFQSRFSLEGLRQAKLDGQQKTELLCQWRSGEEYRYISVTAYFGRDLKSRSYTVLALQDVDDRMRQELAHTQRDMQMAAILKSRYKTMNTVHLSSGQCELVDLTQPVGPENPISGDYMLYMQNALSNRVHPNDMEHFWELLTLDHLREKANATEDYAEEICQYRLREEPVHWMELRILYSRQKDQVMVNILSQDITREKSQEESRLQTLEDRAYIISSLSSLFFSTYYIDLEHDTFRAVTELRRVGDVLGDAVLCSAALQIYANHFIHPDDREEYLKTMNIQNMRQNLRWWKPYLAVEYRKLSEDAGSMPDTFSWVRATAVLARTNAEDMPQTVVYVAQDITDNRRRADGAENSNH